MAESVEASVRRAFAAEGLDFTTWSNGPGAHYDRHSHPFDKVLYCVTGSIVFRTPSGPLWLRPGERLDLLAGTPHEVTVGPDGVTCWEARRS